MAKISPNAKIMVAGARGLVGRAMVRNLRYRGFENIVEVTRDRVDLEDQAGVRRLVAAEQPDVVIDAAAKVGGIIANNTQRTQFIYNNLQIQNNLIDSALKTGVEHFVYLGSSCIYPKNAPQPMREDALLTSQLEPTNRPYALAKIAGLELISSIRKEYGKNYFSVMPTNLFGPYDNFHPEHSHVLPSLMRRFHFAAKEKVDKVTVWGTGAPKREFMFVDECADAIIHLLTTIEMNSFDDTWVAPFGWSHVNIGTGHEVTIKELSEKMAELVGFKGEIEFDRSKPDGPPRKLVDTALLRKLGWQPKITLEKGLEMTYSYFQENVDSLRS